MPPRILLVTVGSLGDLHPFMALGLALKARGASVTLAAAEDYRAKVLRAGLAFTPVRPSFDDLQRDLGRTRAQLTHAVLARTDFLLRRLIMPYVRDSYDDLQPAVARADLIVTSSLAFSARLAAERARVPWVGVVLQPFMFLSAHDAPVLPRLEGLSAVLRVLGPSVARAYLRLVKAVLARQLGPLAGLRADIGLAEARGNPLFEGQFSARGAIALYSPLLGAARPDYPQPTLIAGFARFDSDDGAPAVLDGALSEFLASGGRPLVFTLGSLIVNSPGAFYRESVAAARRLGLRAVLLMGDLAATAGAALRGADVLVVAYAPHSLLFPAAAAIVHHGGIGTLSQALGSGRPQLIVPHYADQIDNAARAVGLGVGLCIPPRRYSAATAARHLAVIMGSPAYAVRADELRERLAGEDGADSAACAILQ